MNLDDQESEDDTRADLTPLIDVVFQLLIFFLLATTFADPERELELDLPSAESGQQLDLEPEELVIDVLADGSIQHAGTRLSAGQLRSLLATTAEANSGTSVTIRGERQARHEAIVSVLDACGSAGLTQLSIATRAPQPQ